MFFTRIGLEQATDEWVARYKAARIATFLDRGGECPGSLPVVADFCCGIGGDLMALAQVRRTVGIDHDAVTAHFAAINTGAAVETTDVAEFDFDGIAAWHVDPDRRRVGKRTTSLDWCLPNRTTIEQLLRRVPHAAVKLAPASEVPVEWGERCELEWIGRDRECRQLVAWHGNLALAAGQRRATVLPVAGDFVLRTIVGQPNQTIPIAEKPDRCVFDLDPAVLAARLKGALAIEYNLSALADGPTYLTGPQPIDDYALACFAVDAVLPFRVAKLARYLGARGIGQLEIKKRGVDVDPEKLRRELKLRGDNAATLLIACVAGRSTAIVAHRMPT